MNNRRTVLGLLAAAALTLCLSLPGFAPAADAAEASPARKALEVSISRVLDCIKNPDYVNPATRPPLRRQIEDEVYHIFDFGEFSSRTGGPRWKEFSAAQKKSFSNAFADLLLTTYLSARCPVVVAPAMDLDMYAHPTTQENLRRLAGHGVRIAEPAEGELASGLTGKGRMAEPAEIAAYVGTLLAAENPEKKKHLSGKRFVVTAGATIEAIDPVRFISNHSSGKMGYAIAGALAARGAQVTLVTGRTSLPTPPGVERVDVLSAAEMYDAATGAFDGADGAVMCAAVADYTPDAVSQTKLKKGEGEMHITLRRTRDIAAELGAAKGGRLLVGFALETHDEQANAEAKLARKNFDFIVLNSLRDAGAGFRGDTNKVTFIDRNGREPLPLMPKSEVAGRIVDKIESLLK